MCPSFGKAVRPHRRTCKGKIWSHDKQSARILESPRGGDARMKSTIRRPRKRRKIHPRTSVHRKDVLMRNSSKVARHNAMLEERAARKISAQAVAEPWVAVLASAVIEGAKDEDLVSVVYPMESGFHRTHPKSRHSKRAGLGLRAYDARQQRNRADHGIDPAVIGSEPAEDYAQFEYKPRHADLQFRKDGDGSLIPPAVRVNGEFVRYHDILVDDNGVAYVVKDGQRYNVTLTTE